MPDRMFSASLLIAAASAACGSQVDSDYDGEPIATLRASVSSADPADELPPLEIDLMWDGNREFAIVAAEVSGDFPTEVTLEVQAPPPRGTLSDFGDGIPVALTELMLFERGAAETDSNEEGFSAVIYGQAQSHALVYLGEDAPAGSVTAEILGGPQTAGFHVLEVSAAGEESPDSPLCEDDLDDTTPPIALSWWCGGGYDRLSPAAGDLDTLIPVTVGEVQALSLPSHGE